MARFHLHLSDEEFYRLTPRQFHLLLDRHHEQAHQQELLMGILAAVTRNGSMYRPKKDAVPADFMPSQWRRETATRSPRITNKQLGDRFRSLLDAHPSLVVVKPE